MLKKKNKQICLFQTTDIQGIQGPYINNNYIKDILFTKTKKLKNII